MEHKIKTSIAPSSFAKSEKNVETYSKKYLKKYKTANSLKIHPLCHFENKLRFLGSIIPSIIGDIRCVT